MTEFACTCSNMSECLPNEKFPGRDSAETGQRRMTGEIATGLCYEGLIDAERASRAGNSGLAGRFGFELRLQSARGPFGREAQL